MAVGGRVDYDLHGGSYARHRRAEPRIAARIHAAFSDARTVLNVGAGAGSYEPDDRWVLAVEPSATGCDPNAGRLSVHVNVPSPFAVITQLVVMSAYVPPLDCERNTFTLDAVPPILPPPVSVAIADARA